MSGLGFLHPVTSLLRAATYRRATGVRALQQPLLASSVRGVSVGCDTWICHHGTASAGTPPGPNTVKMVGQTFSRGRQLTAAVLDPGAGYVQVEWQDDGTTHYPYLWLRDNCTCDICYEPSSHSRLTLMPDLDINTTPSSVQVDRDAGSLKVTWTDGHVSNYSADWLEGRSFTEEVQEERRKWLLPREPQHWGAELADNIPTFTFKQLLEDDKPLYDWITALEEIGLALVKETPQTPGQLTKLGSRVAFLRTTHYGDEFEVKVKMDPNNLGYTPCKLNLHTDLPYYYYAPEMQMLHCIKQVPTEGGANELVDGFRVAMLLKERHPEMFDLLASTHMDFQDMGTDIGKYFKIGRKPTISLNHDGSIDKLSLSDQHRDSFLSLPLDIVNRLYIALKNFYNIAYEPGNMIQYKLQNGDILCFNNCRVLHGRTSFRLLKGGERHLAGAYIDWDELRCRRRVIMADLKLYQ